MQLPTVFLMLFIAVLSHRGAIHYDEAYNHDYGPVANHPDWMSRVDGNKRISELSLPGTHDSMSVNGGDIAQNQTMNLLEQLYSGVRVFDIRARHIDNQFRMHHGIVPQNTWFGEDVLRVINFFLEAFPSETILFRLKPEYSETNNTRSFTDTLNAYLEIYGSKRWIPTSQNPTLDEVRGKFIILQDFTGQTPNRQPYGIFYLTLDIQDQYKMGTNWNLHSKWTAVKEHINRARAFHQQRIFMNYLTGSYGSFPYFVVSGHSSHGTSAPRLSTGLTTPGWWYVYPDFPRTSCFIGICTIAFEGTNTLTANYIIYPDNTPVGIIMTDFPGKRLIENIIRLNH
ncbi:phosphatidylinositol-specific phospholipase C [Endozoicomonas ascidiicola]|uniref:phosphatidylinositol-specific phospholipase C n=1 Tax=Endozoicomonas ascidiicola TaxID=1698521 RepID=UPI000832E163|nr:phosphatidylinositol-specific phospholipase C [Endozoicomonas ascidiicola]